MRAKRVFLIILDSFGIGEMPDADLYGDKGANTLRSISESRYFKADNLIRLGLSHIDGVGQLYGNVKEPLAAYARLSERSKGKDTTTGHFEISGVISEKPFPTFPEGFPEEIIKEFSEKCGRGVICNKPYSGTEVIKKYGKEHVESGKYIVYTSADSVFQIAAHEEVVPLEELYSACRIAREILKGDAAVGRVIARPFVGDSKNGFVRTANRHDFSLEAQGYTLLDALKKAGRDVIAVGKITDIFASRGITESIFTSGNDEGMEKTFELEKRDFSGLCFVNLVDFDMLYGHRNDIDGYAAAISRFDEWLGTFLPLMREDDVLIISADHGCDPGDASTDHTREYTPLLIYGDAICPANLGTRSSFSCIAATVAQMLGVEYDCGAESLLSLIEK